MAYSPPAGNAILFDFVGGAYAAPAGNAVLFDLAVAQGSGSGVLTSWGNITITAYAPAKYTVKQYLNTNATITFNGQPVGTGIIQTTKLTSTWANITLTPQLPSKQTQKRTLAVWAQIVITPYTPTLFNGQTQAITDAASIVITPYAPVNLVKLKKDWGLQYTIWHTTLDVAANLTITPREPFVGFRIKWGWDFLYDIRDTEIPINLDWGLVYSARTTWEWGISYGLNYRLARDAEIVYNLSGYDLVQQDWGLVYSTNIRLAWQLPYSIVGPVKVRKGWGLVYALQDFLQIDWGIEYDLTEPVVADFEINYQIDSFDRLSKGFRFVYSINGTSVLVNTSEPFITYQGRDVRIVEGDISISEGGYTWEGNFTLADIADYVQFRQDEEFTVNLYGEEWTFVVDGKELSRNAPAQISLRLIGVSPSARFTSPRAVEQDYLWDTTVTALDAVNQVTASDISWNTVNWSIPGFRLAFDNAPAIDVVKALAEASGAVVESSKGGQLRVRPLYPISVPDYDAATADHTYVETSDILSVSESYAIAEIYNKFRIADVDLAQQDGMEWVPDYSGALVGYMRVFPYPWRLDVNLIHTGDGTVFIGPQTVAYYEYEEIVEVYQGQGSTQYPIFVLLEVEFFGANLGGVTFVPDVREFTVTGPLLNSVIRIKYRTRYLRYRLISGSGLATQFLLESAPLP